MMYVCMQNIPKKPRKVAMLDYIEMVHVASMKWKHDVTSMLDSSFPAFIMEG